ncbi:signal transduction histidine kinase [Caldalkalibacillus uzonensis]|uniref:Signal transduction histidine kinase n=1 Tax=Caldalkalibacillus uzonensis TaxID=353224 RepID=A0ABU0CSV3_9BACI|nr:Spo0B domain-containing protein [Caldalkalibacillus uzonensis]MDQ0339505.1 signal transduction histidine kinase [Caldalkalibacillus uzonensis]
MGSREPQVQLSREALNVERMTYDERQVKKRFIDHLRHYRHDILNHIQMVKGYIQLGRLDDVKRYIDHIVLQAHQESLLSQLGDPELAYLLLTYNYRRDNKLNLDVEVNLDAEQMQQIGQSGRHVFHMVNQLLQLVETGCDPAPSEFAPQLYLLFDGDDRYFSVMCDYRGAWNQDAGLRCLPALQDKVTRCQGKLVEEVNHEQQLTLEIICPWTCVR